MPTFMETCCCAGRRPEGVVSRRHVPRPDLVARLLQDRRVARFVVAPTGFGKSCLAFEYANMVFSFHHVFWINGRSPCFLRDLDSGSLLSALLRIDADAHLVVLEDVPRLDAERTRAFCDLVDNLLSRKIEVLITCVPSADAFSLLQRDRVLLCGRDLLLCDAEMRREAAEGRISGDQLASARESDRVACLRWSDEGARVLALGVRDEGLPGSTRLAMLVILALRQGHVDDLFPFLPGELAREAVAILDEDYPFFGVDERTASFRSASVGFDVLAESFSACMSDMVSSSLLESRDALCSSLALALLKRHETQRACAFVLAFATKNCMAQWLVRHGWAIVARAEPASFCEMRMSVARAVVGVSEQLSSIGAWACYALGDVESALAQARRVVRSGSAGPLEKMRALVLLAHAGVGEVRTRAVDELARLLEPGSVAGKDAREACERGEEPFDWPCAARVAIALDQGVQAGLDLWMDACFDDDSLTSTEDEACRCALMLTAAWLMDAYVVRDGEVAGAEDQRFSPCQGGQSYALASSDRTPGDLERLARYVGDALEAECSEGAASWYAVVAASALTRLVSLRPRLAAYLPAVGTMIGIHRVEASLAAQGEEYRRLHAARQQKRREFQLTHPDAFRKDDASAQPAVSVRTGAPMMDVTLFGGLEVRVGESMVSPRAFSRQKTRMLLALLVLSRGREVSRDRLAALLWPESCPDTARRNLYSVWSQLRRAITIEGSCPYLIRSQSGFRLDVRLVTSDAFAFESLCRSLMFGSPEAEDWERLYTQVSTSYGADLMPCEERNEVMDQLRSRYRMQLVDGLIAASKRLLLQGEPRGSLWFARAALERDHTREDAYVTLMEAQIGADQRGAALDTYFACRRFLTEQLGIDPSPYLVSLYRSIIETEEVLM